MSKMKDLTILLYFWPHPPTPSPKGEGEDGNFMLKLV
jgi:hypothetical protein